MKERELISCENCIKCGETICGNDTEHLSCFEGKPEVTKKEYLKIIKRHLKGIEKCLEKMENE